MELIKKQIHCGKTGKPVSSQFFIDEDYNVPDSKNDIARVVLGKGNVKVEEIRRMENYLKLGGKLTFQVLYVTEEGEVRLTSLEGKVPFEEMVYVEDEEEQTFFIKNMRVEFHVSMIHSRKLNVKALVEVELLREGLSDKELTTDAEGDDSLLKKRSRTELLQMHTSKNDTYRIKEEVTLPGTKENIGTLLWVDVTGRKLDTKLAADELRLSGELLLFCLYESQEGKTDWVEQAVPYEGRVECYGVDETMYHYVIPELEDVNVDIRMDGDGELRTLGIEGTLGLRISVYEEEQVEILEDIYSLRENCIPKVCQEVCEQLVLQNHSKCKISEQLSIPELKEDVLQICNSRGTLQVEKMEPEDGGIRIEGILHIQFLYVKGDDEVPFDTWSGIVPFTYLLEAGDMDEAVQFDITNSVEQLTVTLMGSGEVEVKAVLAFHSFLRKSRQIPVISEIGTEPFDMEEMKNRAGITGYIVKDGDELWDLAKKYATTEEGIMEVNEMTSSKLNAGDKILIFKENMSIL